MTDDHHTPEGADGLHVTITCGNCYNEREARLFSIGKDIKQFYNEHRTRIGRTFCSIEAICVRYDPVAAEVHASNRRLLDAVEGVIGEDEKQPDNEPYMATRIDPYAYQRNKVRAELRAALKGLREGNDG